MHATGLASATTSPAQARLSGPVARWELAAVLGLAALAVALLAWRWVGFQGHDQASYLAAALDWIQHFPPLGRTHWSLRYPIVLPTAAAIVALGPTTFALALVNLVAYALFLVVGYVAARHWLGPLAAVLVTLIGIVLPQFLVQATYTNPDLVETSLSMTAFWALMAARERGGSVGLLLACGALAGLGFMTRETTVMVLIVFGAIWLVRPGMPRWRYLWAGLAFAIVMGAQIGYLTARTGDVAYRFEISAGHDRVDRDSKLEGAEQAGHALDTEGVLATSPWLSPFAAIMVSQKYGLLFILAIPAYLLVRWRRDLAPRERMIVDWTGFGALVGFLFIAVNAEILYVVPRYFMLSAAFASVPLAALAAKWLQDGGWQRALAALGVAGFVASSLLLMALENTHPLRAEERIADFAAATGDTVHVDPETGRELGFFLLSRGLQDRVTTAAPGPGDLVASEDGVVQSCLANPRCDISDRMRAFAPQPGWTTVARLAPPRTIFAGPLAALGLRARLPPDLWQRLSQPGSTAVVYRLPSG